MAFVFYDVMDIHSVNLRPIHNDDWDLLVRIERDSDSPKYSTLEMPSEQELLVYLNSNHDFFLHGQMRFVIEYLGKAVGFLDFSDASVDFRIATIGIIILPEFRRMHIASKAIAKSMIQARIYRIEKLIAFVSPENSASENLFIRAGFAFSEIIDTYHVYTLELIKDI